MGDFCLSLVALFGAVLFIVQGGVMLGDDGVKSLLELSGDAHHDGRRIVGVVVVEQLIDLSCTEMLEGGLDSVGNHLICGLEVALTVIGGLNAHVCEILDSAASGWSPAWRVVGRLLGRCRV